MLKLVHSRHQDLDTSKKHGGAVGTVDVDVVNGNPTEVFSPGIIKGSDDYVQYRKIFLQNNYNIDLTNVKLSLINSGAGIVDCDLERDHDNIQKFDGNEGIVNPHTEPGVIWSYDWAKGTGYAGFFTSQSSSSTDSTSSSTEVSGVTSSSSTSSSFVGTTSSSTISSKSTSSTDEDISSSSSSFPDNSSSTVGESTSSQIPTSSSSSSTSTAVLTTSSSTPSSSSSTSSSTELLFSTQSTSLSSSELSETSSSVNKSTSSTSSGSSSSSNSSSSSSSTFLSRTSTSQSSSSSTEAATTSSSSSSTLLGVSSSSSTELSLTSSSSTSSSNTSDSSSSSSTIALTSSSSTFVSLTSSSSSTEADVTSSSSSSLSSFTGTFAAQFTASQSEYLSVANNPSLPSGDIDFSINMWVYMDSKPSQMIAISKWGTVGGSIGYEIEYLGGGTDRIRFGTSQDGNSAGVVLVANSFGSPPLNTWFNIQAWHDSVADTLNIKINDGTTDSVAHATGIFDSSAGIDIGRVGGGIYWDGRVDSTGLWKKVLSGSEITELYNSGCGKTYAELSTGIKTSMSAWWDFEEVSGTRVDSHSNNDLTDNNTVTRANGVACEESSSREFSSFSSSSSSSENSSSSTSSSDISSSSSSTSVSSSSSSSTINLSTSSTSVSSSSSSSSSTEADETSSSSSSSTSLSSSSTFVSFTSSSSSGSSSSSSSSTEQGETSSSSSTSLSSSSSSTINLSTSSTSQSSSSTEVSVTSSSSSTSESESSSSSSTSSSVNESTSSTSESSSSFPGTFAAQFTAANSEYLDVPHNSSQPVGDIDFMYSTWVYLDSKPARAAIIAKWGTIGGEFSYFIEYAGGGVDRFRIGTSQNGTATGAVLTDSTFGSPSTGEWIFLVFWNDSAGDTLNLQVNNGTSQSVAMVGGVFEAVTEELQIGRFGTAQYFNGRIGPTGAWKRILSTSERTDLYADGCGLIYDNLTSDIKRNLSSYWDFDEASGTRWDSHGPNHLTDNNTVTQANGVAKPEFSSSREFSSFSSSSSSSTSSSIEFSGFSSSSSSTSSVEFSSFSSSSGPDSAALFDGVNQSLSILDNASVSPGDIDFTIACWVYIQAKNSTNRGIVTKWHEPTGQREFMIYYSYVSDEIQFLVSDDGVNETIVSAPIGSPKLNTWYLVVAKHDSVNDQISISINDDASAIESHTGGVFDGSADLVLGAQQNGGAISFLDGRMAMLGYWKNRLLTAKEVQTLFNGGIGKLYASLPANLLTNLESYLNLDEHSGTRFDNHGSNDFTDNNSVGFEFEPFANLNSSYSSSSSSSTFESFTSSTTAILDTSSSNESSSSDRSFSTHSSSSSSSSTAVSYTSSSTSSSQEFSSWTSSSTLNVNSTSSEGTSSSTENLTSSSSSTEDSETSSESSRSTSSLEFVSFSSSSSSSLSSPSSVNSSSSSTEQEFTINSLPAGSAIGMWLRMTVTPSDVYNANDFFTIYANPIDQFGIEGVENFQYRLFHTRIKHTIEAHQGIYLRSQTHFVRAHFEHVVDAEWYNGIENAVYAAIVNGRKVIEFNGNTHDINVTKIDSVFHVELFAVPHFNFPIEQIDNTLYTTGQQVRITFKIKRQEISGIEQVRMKMDNGVGSFNDVFDVTLIPDTGLGSGRLYSSSKKLQGLVEV